MCHSYAFYQPVVALAESAMALGFVGEESVPAALASSWFMRWALLGMQHSPSGIMKARLTWRDVRTRRWADAIHRGESQAAGSGGRTRDGPVGAGQ